MERSFVVSYSRLLFSFANNLDMRPLAAFKIDSTEQITE